MRIITITKLILFFFSLAGITSLLWVLPHYDLLNPSEETFYAIKYDYPLRTYLAGACLVLLLALSGWTIAYRPPRDIYTRFRQLDSNALDTNSNLCRQFYKAALEYRMAKGSKNFQRYFIRHYDFFYDFHNYALSWIDELLNSLPTSHVPQDFILCAICKGHVGQVFMDVHYAAGLTIADLKENDPLLLHACADHIEVWAYTLKRPICKIRNRTIKLQNAHRHPNHLTAIFTGIDQSGQRRHQIEMRFLTRDYKNGQSHQSIARQRIVAFKQWLKEAAKHRSGLADDYGIDVSELMSPSRLYDSPLTRALGRLEGKQIQAFHTRATLPIIDNNIPLDAVVLCKGVGIVTINERLESGDITYSGDPLWHQYISDDIREINNPCIQAKLARSSLNNLLSAHNLSRWPVVSLVVYSCSDVTLSMHIGRQRLQCNVIKLENLDKWFSANNKNEKIYFTDNDLALFSSVLSGEAVSETPLEYATV